MMIDIEAAWPYLRDLTALIGGGFALVTYRRGQRQRRAEWLDGLYTRFFEQPQYKRIRRVLDYEVEPDLTDLRRGIEANQNSDICEELVDYLNFFEFLGSLEEMGQVSDAEMSMLFEYYIGRLNGHPFVIRFVKDQGFERLAAILGRRRIPTVPLARA
jgi:hypothetical protein